MGNAANQRPSAVEVQDNYTTLIDYSGGTDPIYIGKAKVGTATSATGWAIRKLTWDGNSNPTAIEWADGVESFNKIYDDRVGYSYS